MQINLKIKKINIITVKSGLNLIPSSFLNADKISTAKAKMPRIISICAWVTGSIFLKGERSISSKIDIPKQNEAALLKMEGNLGLIKSFFVL